MSTTLKRSGEPGGKERRGGRVRSLIGEHRKLVGAVAVLTIGLGIFAFLWFRPDKIFVDTKVDEALPTAPAPGASGSSAAPGSTGAPAAQGAVLSSGPFRSLEHETKGIAKIVELADGSRVVRLEDFRTSSGPDVVVILSSTAATEDSWGAYDDGEFVNLGALRGNVGSQNYKIPGNVDLSRFRSVVIWCRRFNVAFGAAPIAAPIT
jgi:hypothetical protein